MDFKNWLLVLEMGRARVPEGEHFSVPSLPDPQTGRRGAVTVTPECVIDMRFEDYGLSLGDFSPWQVKLPDGRYLVNHGMYEYEISAAPGKYQEVPQTSTGTADGASHPWYDFAEITDGGNTVLKQPVYRQGGN